MPCGHRKDLRTKVHARILYNKLPLNQAFFRIRFPSPLKNPHLLYIIADMGIIKTVLSFIIAMFISGGVSGMSEVTPADAATDFLDGISGGDRQIAESYMDNTYVSFLENVKGTDEEMDRMEDALFANLSYDVTDTAVKGDIAVAKVTVTNSDFSKSLDAYKSASYKYVMDNLYDEEVTDKTHLNEKCLDIYIEQLEKSASAGAAESTDIFIPMESDGYYGWRLLLNDDIMKTILGGLELPADE